MKSTTRQLKVHERIKRGFIPDFATMYADPDTKKAISKSEWVVTVTDVYNSIYIHKPEYGVFTFFRVNKSYARSIGLTLDHLHNLARLHNENLLIGMSDEEFNHLREDAS